MTVENLTGRVLVDTDLLPVILTEDNKDFSSIEGISIINPFARSVMPVSNQASFILRGGLPKLNEIAITLLRALLSANNVKRLK